MSWWWVTVPRALARRYAGLSVVAADGHTLVGLGPAAALLPPLALAGGLVVGAAGLGYEETFTQSLALVLTVGVVGMSSTLLGALFVAGFAVGDFLLGHTAWTTRAAYTDVTGPLSDPLIANLVIERVPLLIQYALLATLAVAVPLGARTLAASVALRLRLPPGVHLWVTAVLVALTAFVLARFWASAAPLVIRPVFTWTLEDGINQGVPPTGAIEPIQANELTIARVAALAVLGRAALTWVLSRARPARLAAVEAALLAPVDRRVVVPGPLRQVGQAGSFAVTSVLFMAGLIDDLSVAVALVGVFFVGRLAKSGLLPLPTRRWREVVGRVPVLVRFGAVLLVVNGVSKAAVASSLNTEADRFQFLVWPVAAGALLMATLIPTPLPEPGVDEDGAR